MAWKIKSAEFIISATKLEQLPKADLPEIAFIGRSNAGKSTLVNRLCGQKKLAKVSATPGKTQQVNLFLLTLVNGNQSCQVHLADLPGYGFANVSKSKHSELIKIIAEYFKGREQLKKVFLLSDIRRKMNEIDVNLIKYIASCERKRRIVLTKSDKVNQKEKAESIRFNSKYLNLDAKEFLLAGSNIDTFNILVDLIEDL